ncbi:unnamed protein product [Linum trigynum]|uniref:Uncharacterized protein n=1 Tax=Linum trigynum TaxID=586398 RepID=A0AAV2CJU5_9ROSI
MKSERPTKKRRLAPLTANVKKKKPRSSGARCRRVRCSLLEKKGKDCSPTENEEKKKGGKDFSSSGRASSDEQAEFHGGSVR